MKRPSDNISKQLNFANHVPRITYREISIPGRERPLNAERHIIGRSHEMVEITTFFWVHPIIAPVGKYRNCLSVLPFGKPPFGADAPLSPGGGK
jgi:hypothetical protein